MADYTAIYEAGRCLVDYLRDVLTPEPVSKKELISLCSPYEPENNQLTVYMYTIEEDPAVVNEGFTSFSTNTEKMSPTSLQAGFLITAHSNAPAHMREEDRYRILGAAIQAIKDMPVMDPKYLSGSLAKAEAQIRVNMDHVKHEDMIKIWNNNSVAYKTSIVVTLTGIDIDSKRSRRISRVSDIQIGVDRKKEI